MRQSDFRALDIRLIIVFVPLFPEGAFSGGPPCFGVRCMGLQPLEFEIGGGSDGADQSIDDGGSTIQIAHDVTVVEIRDEPGMTVQPTHYHGFP